MTTNTTPRDHNWLDDQDDDRKPDLNKLGFEYGYFQSHKRYVRTAGVMADITVYGLWTFHARGLEFKDGYLRLIIPAGRKPKTLANHLVQIAPGLEFFYVEAPERDFEYEQEPFVELEG